MTIEDFLKQYGTKGASLVIRRLADRWTDKQMESIARELAVDLENTLTEFAHRPPSSPTPPDEGKASQPPT